MCFGASKERIFFFFFVNGKLLSVEGRIFSMSSAVLKVSSVVVKGSELLGDD